jgi:hypothetical protein
VEAFDHGTVPGLWGLLRGTMPVWASARQATGLLTISMNFRRLNASTSLSR